MAKVLVVDDREVNREFLVKLLGYAGHETAEAGDGAEALKYVRTDRPDLVIADILMPTMDGYELVRQIRADPAIASTPVIFHTANYHQQQARDLAESSGIVRFLTKPCPPATLLQTVDEALKHQGGSISPPLGEAYSQAHLQLLTNQLSQKVDQLEAVNQRLSAMHDLVQRMTKESNSQDLLKICCQGARELLGAGYAAIAIQDENRVTLRHFITSGLSVPPIARKDQPTADHGLLSVVFAEDRPIRLRNLKGDPALVGFSPEQPPIRSLLGAPVASFSRRYGAIILVDKLGAIEFNQEDERVLGTLATHLAIAYENVMRYEQLQEHSGKLEEEVAQRRRIEEELRQLNEDLDRRVRDRTAELEAINKELQSFSASAAHDLRSPIRVIELSADLILRERAGILEPEDKDHLDRILSAAKQMEQLIEDLMKLSYLDHIAMEPISCDVSSVGRQVAAELQRPNPDRQVDFQIADGMTAEADPQLLHILIENLLGNAWKYTMKEPHTRIEFGQKEIGGAAVYFVRDNGAGFNMEYASKLFQPFQRLHRQSDFPGSGIGLTTVQRIIERHGGEVWAEGAVGQGATFYFTFEPVKDQQNKTPGRVDLAGAPILAQTGV